MKQAGAELCQAQAQVYLPAEADFNLTVEFQNCNSLEKVICPVIFSDLGHLPMRHLLWNIFYFLKNSKIALHSTRVNLQLLDSMLS